MSRASADRGTGHIDTAKVGNSTPIEENRMLNDLKSQRIVLSLEVDRARRWRSSAALDKIKQSLEARLTALDKAIKAEVETAGV
jgi:hypothetical protein